MTNFILNGGSTSMFMSDPNKVELLKDGHKISQSFKVMVIPFTKYPEFWEVDYQKSKDRFINAFPNNEVAIEMAKDSRTEFLSLFNESLIIVIPGGGEPSFIETLSKIINIEKEFILDNKIVYANSAGVNVLAKYYYSNDRQTFGEGLGILPIKTICHYSEERLEKLQKLESYKEKLPIIALRETSAVQIFI